jgi:ABC-type dipeptide/oligopeptide/nickel transport system permease subunit
MRETDGGATRKELRNVDEAPVRVSNAGGIAGNIRQSRKTGAALFVRRLSETRLALPALIVILAISLMAIFAPVIAPDDPETTHLTDALQGPGAQHWLGTDNLGRDVLSRIIFGARISMQVGIIAVGISLIAGTTLGLVSGYTRISVIDTLIMRIMDALLAFPTLVLALAISAALGPSLRNVMIAVGFIGIPTYARLVRGQVLSEREHDYVDAARTIGVHDMRILYRHVLPNVTAPLIVQSSIGVAFAIIEAASLSFLGLGVQPPTPSWGGMLAIGKNYLDHSWWMAIPPGLAIFAVVLAFNFLGDGIRDALDPHLQHR